MTPIFQVFVGLLAIAALLALHALALYLIWWFVMIVISYFPMVGRKHRHANWEGGNGRHKPQPDAHIGPGDASGGHSH